MKKIVTTLAGAAMIAALSTGANAQASGEASIWGMGVFTSHGVDEGGACGDPGNLSFQGEFCDDVLGGGASLSFYAPLTGNLSVSGDLFFETHGDTHELPAEQDDDAAYGHIGFHLTNESNPDMPWGGFTFVAGGENLADNDKAGPVLGLGGEVMISGFAIQAGGMWLVDSSSNDTMENMAFVGVSKEFAIWNGKMTTGAIVGNGDFQDASNSYAKGNWGQLSVFYEAPLGSGKLNWFTGYQLDYVDGFGGGDLDRALFHSVKIGITIPFGSGAGPFKTPNFRAPVTSSGELNS